MQRCAAPPSPAPAAPAPGVDPYRAAPLDTHACPTARDEDRGANTPVIVLLWIALTIVFSFLALPLRARFSRKRRISRQDAINPH